MTFDANQFKATTKAQWDEFAGGWNAWGPTIEAWVGAATERMLDLADVRAGSRVLDVAAGTGGQSLAAARRAGERGEVLATDISPVILEFAEHQARSAGISTLRTRTLDGEAVGDLDDGDFDAVISRLGLIYFPDRHLALKGVHGSLKDGGKVATISFAAGEHNGFFARPVAIARAAAGLPAPSPDQPGPFSFADPASVTSELEAAGFRDVVVEVVEAPVKLSSAAECVRFERDSFGALHQMLQALEPEGRERAWDEIGEELSDYEDEDGFVGPCRLVLAGATR